MKVTIECDKYGKTNCVHDFVAEFDIAEDNVSCFRIDVYVEALDCYIDVTEKVKRLDTIYQAIENSAIEAWAEIVDNPHRV